MMRIALLVAAAMFGCGGRTTNRTARPAPPPSSGPTSTSSSGPATAHAGARIAYLVTGHGEINDPESVPPALEAKVPRRKTTVLRKRLGEAGYEVRDLGAATLASHVPSDATIVFLLAPVVPLQKTEWRALAAYLDRGGGLLVALDPEADPSLGELGGKLGVKFDPAPLTDDRMFLATTGSAADHRVVVTSRFEEHASTMGMSRTKSALVLIDSGTLAEMPFAGAGADQPTRTVTIRSMPTTFLDLNDNDTFDAASEKRQSWDIAMAIEAPRLPRWRALVFADADLFADVLVNRAGIPTATVASVPLLEDCVRWLGGAASGR